MSTTPDTIRADDEIVTLLSGWLAFHVTNESLREHLEEIGTSELNRQQTAAVDELLEELGHSAAAKRGDLEMIVRETLEAVALG